MQVQGCYAMTKTQDYKQLFAGTRKYNCQTCYHQQTGSCETFWDEGTCCGYWYSPTSKIQGIAYNHEPETLPLFN